MSGNFSFLIGGDGRVYEGRGWRSVGKQYKKEEMAALNYRSIEIAYIGYYEGKLKKIHTYT